MVYYYRQNGKKQIRKDKKDKDFGDTYMKKRRKGRIREFERSGMQMPDENRSSRQMQSAGESGVSCTPKKKKMKINRGRLILTAIVLVMIAVVGMSVKNIFDLRAEQEELKQQKKILLQEEQSLKEELKNVNDLDYIEEQARIQLRMIKPGEILYITDDDLKENKQEGNGDGQQSDKEED